MVEDVLHRKQMVEDVLHTKLIVEDVLHRKQRVEDVFQRKQMAVGVLHPGRPPCTEVGEKLARMYKTTPNVIVYFGLRTQFDGGKTIGFDLVFDTLENARRFKSKCTLYRPDRQSLLELKMSVIRQKTAQSVWSHAGAA